jgi:TatD DNase family protein
MLVDTHCHIPLLIDENINRKLEPSDYQKASMIIDEAAESDVTTLVTIGSTSYIDSVNCSLLAKQYKQVFATVGLFPHDCTESWQEDLKKLIPLLADNPKIVAIGECGLDYHYPDYNASRQKDAFRAQIELALKYNRSLVIHTRQAPDDTLDIIDEYASELQGSVFHCFSEDLSFAEHVIQSGFYIGIPATVTYPKNERLRSIIKHVGLEHIVLETDSPFLPPQHMRGKKNHPREISTIAHFIAEFLHIDYHTVATITTHNAYALYRLHDSV